MPAPQGRNPGFNTHHELLITDAATMQTRYTESEDFESQPTGGFFFRQGSDSILAQPDCIGLRYYFTFDSDVLRVILLGVEKGTYDDLFEGIIIGNAQADPPYGDGDAISAVEHEIIIEEATDTVSAFRTNYPDQRAGGFFFRSIIDNIIDLDNVIGLRYKFGLTTEDKLVLILNPANDSFLDIDIYNAGGQKIKCEASNDDGGDNQDNPLI